MEMDSDKKKILKFGGSSIDGAERIETVIKIIIEHYKQNELLAVVFSAFQSITNKLVQTARLAATGSDGFTLIYNDITGKHYSIARSLVPVDIRDSVIKKLNFEFESLREILDGIYKVKELSARNLDNIMSFGERLSTRIIYSILISKEIKCDFLDAGTIIKTDSSFGNANVDFIITEKNIKDYFQEHPDLQIVTGFVASNLEGETTTLGRGGSDYTASILASALDASEIEIWTDVNGFLTADPKKVRRAFPLNNLSYEEAMELSYFGAKVIHTPTIEPALDKKIPIRIKNTFNRDFNGTLISTKNGCSNNTVKSISSIDNVSLIKIQRKRLNGIHGVTERIFTALSKEDLKVLLITQASSGYSISIAVLQSQSGKAIASIEKEFRYELQEKIINTPLAENNLSIIAVVGEEINKTAEVSAKIFQALGRNGITIKAIAQGSSELNFSVVISAADESKALNVLHDTLFLANLKTINIYMVGTGLVGGTLLSQFKSQVEYLSNKQLLNLKIIGLANTRKMILNEDGVDINSWKDELDRSVSKSDLGKFIKQMVEFNLPNTVFVDCTASEEVAALYKTILDSNISVVAANKKANSSGYDYYASLRQSSLKHNVAFSYETNVGAGLPIIGTIKDLISSGDQIEKIEGVLSGTLSYIFNSFTNEKTFTEIIKEAREKGFTEPDPREDLSGMDVARKLLILSRETGLKLELQDIKIENLLPETAVKAESIEEFFKQMDIYHDEFEKKKVKALQSKKTLRYIAKIENSRAEIKLLEVGEDHPFYSLSESDNIVAFTTKYYKNRPLVIKGPGAGADVTASGVFADILRISNYLR